MWPNGSQHPLTTPYKVPYPPDGRQSTRPACGCGVATRRDGAWGPARRTRRARITVSRGGVILTSRSGPSSPLRLRLHWPSPIKWPSQRSRVPASTRAARRRVARSNLACAQTPCAGALPRRRDGGTPGTRPRGRAARSRSQNASVMFVVNLRPPHGRTGSTAPLTTPAGAA
jgi:hypothetical protein